MSEESKSLRLFNMPWQIFAVFAAIVLVATYMGVLPKGMIGAFPFMIVVGAVLNEIGNRCPIVNTYHSRRDRQDRHQLHEGRGLS